MSEKIDVNPFRIKEKDQRLACSTHKLVPRRRDISRKDIDAYVENVESYRKEQKEKKIKKIDDIEVIPET